MNVPAPLSVDADLTLTAGEDTFRLIGRGGHVVVEAQSVRAVLRLSRLFASPRERQARLGQLQTVLRATNIEVEFQVRGRTVARIDPETRPGWPFRYGPMRIHPMRMLWSWLTEGRKTTGVDR